MAVSGKTAAPHEIPYYLGTDKPPDMAAVTKAMADQTAARLDAIAPKQITGVAKKQLLIANASGVVTAVLASGDVTNDESGVFSIGAKKVVASMLGDEAATTAKVQDHAITLVKLAESLGLTEGYLADEAVGEAKVKDGAVTSRKFKPSVGIKRASADLPLTESFKEIEMTGGNLEITPAVASNLLVFAQFTFTAHSGNTHKGRILVDAEEREAVELVVNTEGVTRLTTPLVDVIPLTAAKHTIKLQAVSIPSTSSTLRKAGTWFAYLLVAS